MLAAILFIAAVTAIPPVRTAENIPQSARENLDLTISLWETGGLSLVENTQINFFNATFLPFDLSSPALGEYFETARFSVVSGQGVPDFWSFLRVSYADKVNDSEAESYADDVLNEFRKAFSLSLDILNKTHVFNNETASTDIYYQLNDIQDQIGSFKELSKYVPSEGLGDLISVDMLSRYVPSTANAALHDIEYRLTRNSQSILWEFSISLACWQDNVKEGSTEISLKNLLNYSGSISPSTIRTSQVQTNIYSTTTGNKPLTLSLTGSSPPYSNLKDENDVVTLTYNLTSSVDDIRITINIMAETGFNWIYLAVITVPIAITLVAVFLSVRNQRKKNREQKSKKEDTGFVKVSWNQGVAAVL
jgi:hypothetical protein